MGPVMKIWDPILQSCKVSFINSSTGKTGPQDPIPLYLQYFFKGRRRVIKSLGAFYSFFAMPAMNRSVSKLFAVQYRSNNTPCEHSRARRYRGRRARAHPSTCRAAALAASTRNEAPQSAAGLKTKLARSKRLLYPSKFITYRRKAT